jgi:recombinational DNA repair ATPase RecF
MGQIYISSVKINRYKHLSYEGVAALLPGVNIILGKNGSGKTSILEMIRDLSNGGQPGSIAQEEISKIAESHLVRVILTEGTNEEHIDLTKSTNPTWINNTQLPNTVIRYISSTRNVKNQISISNLLKTPNFDIPQPGSEINI